MSRALAMISYLNMLAVIPLYAGIWFAESMYSFSIIGEKGTLPVWAFFLSSPRINCLAIILVFLVVSLKLVRNYCENPYAVKLVYFNIIIMLGVWLLPEISVYREIDPQLDTIEFNVTIREIWVYMTLISVLFVSIIIVPLSSFRQFFMRSLPAKRLPQKDG